MSPSCHGQGGAGRIACFNSFLFDIELTAEPWAEHRAASQDTSTSAAEGKGLEEYKKSEALLCRASRGARMGWGGAGKGLRARNYHKQTVFADASALQLFSVALFSSRKE